MVKKKLLFTVYGAGKKVGRLLLTAHGCRRYGKKVTSYSTWGQAIWWGGSTVHEGRRYGGEVALYMGAGDMVGR